MGDRIPNPLQKSTLCTGMVGWVDVLVRGRRKQDAQRVVWVIAIVIS